MRALGLVLAPALALGLVAPAAAEPVTVTREQAVPARPGRDYTRLMTIHPGEHTYATDVTASGKVVLTRHGQDRVSDFLLLDPETKRRTPLPTPGDYPSILDLGTDEVWYVDSDRAGRATVYRYDRHRQRMRHFLLPDASQRPRYIDRVIGLEGDAIWFTTGDRQEHNDENVWSVDFGKPGTLTQQGRQLGNPTVVDGVLAWSKSGSADGPDLLVMRDLATDEVTRARLPDGCWREPSRVQGNGDRFVLDVGCQNPEGETVVADRSGELTTILDVESDEGDLGTSDRGVFFYWYFYDFTTGRLLDISDMRLGDGEPVSGPGAHPVQVWPQRGGKALVVRLK
jgi:hypothetical protein